MWQVLRMYNAVGGGGVKLLSAIKSMHVDSSACVRVPLAVQCIIWVQ